jgi:hypothetical protein
MVMRFALINNRKFFSSSLCKSKKRIAKFSFCFLSHREKEFSNISQINFSRLTETNKRKDKKSAHKKVVFTQKISFLSRKRSSKFKSFLLTWSMLGR